MNISTLPPEQIRLIELDRKASWLIKQFKRKEITKQQIVKEIYSLKESEQQTFKDLLNKYRAVK